MRTQFLSRHPRFIRYLSLMSIVKLLHTESLNNKLFLQNVFSVSKYLDMPAHAHMLINASAFSSVFTFYVVLVWVVLLYLLMFSGFKPNQYESKKNN